MFGALIPFLNHSTSCPLSLTNGIFSLSLCQQTQREGKGELKKWSREKGIQNGSFMSQRHERERPVWALVPPFLGQVETVCNGKANTQSSPSNRVLCAPQSVKTIHGIKGRK